MRGLPRLIALILASLPLCATTEVYAQGDSVLEPAVTAEATPRDSQVTTSASPSGAPEPQESEARIVVDDGEAATPAREAVTADDAEEASEPEADRAPGSTRAVAPRAATQIREAWPVGVIRLYGGFGALLSGGQVSAAATEPDLFGRVIPTSDLIGADIAVRPFLGGTLIGLSFRMSPALDAHSVTGALHIQLEYDLASLGAMSRPNWGLAIGGSLGFALGWSEFLGTEPSRHAEYWLLRPEWRAYLEARFEIGSDWLFLRPEVTTGFNDLTHVTQLLIAIGCLIDFNVT